jgi:hypothetical protein
LASSQCGCDCETIMALNASGEYAICACILTLPTMVQNQAYFLHRMIVHSQTPTSSPVQRVAEDRQTAAPNNQWNGLVSLGGGSMPVCRW